MTSIAPSFRCFTAFAAELAEIQQMHTLSVAARDVFTKYGYILKKEDTIKYWYAENEIDKKINISDVREDTINKSVLVMSWGSFEQFMRNLVREAAEQRNKHGWVDGIVPVKVRNQHSLVCSSLIAADIRGDLGYLSISRTNVATDMRNLICVESQHILNSEALAAFGGRFHHDELAKLGDRVGVDLSWGKLGENNDLRTLSGKVGKVAVGEWAEELFCEVRDARNNFAHNGAGPTSLDWECVHRYLFYLESLARAIEKAVVSEMSSS